jgi:dienelactone hydrolase
VTIEEYAPCTPGTGDGAVVLLYGSGGLESPAVPYAEEARRLARSGCRVYVPHYLDATGGRATDPESHYGLWAQTVRHAIEYVQLQTGIPQPRTAIAGYSLGGSLALVVAAQEPHLAGVVVWNGSLPDAYWNVRSLPPLLILHGGLDAIIPPYNARQLDEICTTNHLRCELRIYDDEGHAFSAAGLVRANLEIGAFLASVCSPRQVRLPAERAGRYFTTTLSTARLSLSSTTRTAIVCSAAGAYSVNS